jgi:hypothetical protein
LDRFYVRYLFCSVLLFSLFSISFSDVATTAGADAVEAVAEIATGEAAQTARAVAAQTARDAAVLTARDAAAAVAGAQRIGPSQYTCRNAIRHFKLIVKNCLSILI